MAIRKGIVLQQPLTQAGQNDLFSETACWFVSHSFFLCVLVFKFGPQVHGMVILSHTSSSRRSRKLSHLSHLSHLSQMFQLAYRCDFDEKTCKAILCRRAGLCASCQVRSCSSVDQRLGLLLMTMLIALPYRFLLTLGAERARPVG